MADELSFVCTSCGHTAAVPARFAGKATSCPRCRAPGRIGPELVHPVALSAETTSSIEAEVPPEVAAAQAHANNRFGRFVLLGELGRGGMGIVHRAWDLRLARQVAIKTILPDAATTQSIERFRREAAIISRLRHPNIVFMHDVGEFEGRPYIAMDFIEGASLDKRLADPERRLSLTKALEAMRDVARAVHHAHGAGVIHRDLKPQNVMLDRNDFPYVLDFGLARLGRSTGATRTGVALGTPAYMPPEQTGDESREVDARCDVYSLGATLYHVLTGRPPFEGETEINVIAAVLTKDPVPPGTINPRVAGELETIVLRCLEKEPARRYATAAYVADELDRYLAGIPIATKPLSGFARLLRRARRNKVATALVMAGVSSLISGTAIAVGGLVKASRAEDALRRERLQLAEEAAKKAEADRVEEERKRRESEEQLAAACLELAHQSLAERRHREAALYAAKALSIADTPAARVAHVIAREGPWRGSRVLGSHAQFVTSVKFSRDGKLLASSSLDQEVRLWDVDSGKARVLERRQEPVYAVFFSPDSSLCATTAADGVIRLFETSSGRTLRSIETGSAGLNGGAFAPDGRRFVAGVGDLVKVFDVETGRPVKELGRAKKEIGEVDWSDDGALVAAASLDGSMRFWPMEGGEPRTIEIEGNLPHGFSFAAGGRGFAIGMHDGTIRYSPRNDSRLTLPPLRAHTSPVRGVAFSPDGRRLVSASLDQLVGLWDTSSIRLVGLLTGHRGSVLSAAFAPTRPLLATAGADRVVRLWDTTVEGDRTTVGAGRSGAFTLTFTADGKKLIEGGLDGSVAVWDAETRTLLHQIDAHPRTRTIAVAAAEGSNVIASAGTDNAIRFWDTTSGRAEGEIPVRGEGRITNLALSRSGRRLAVAIGPGGFALCDPQGGRREFRLVEGVYALELAFSPDGNRIAVGDLNGAAVIFDAETRARVATCAGHASDVPAVAWTPDGKHLVTGGNDGTVRLFDATTGLQLALLGEHRKGVTAVDVDGKGELIASCAEDGVIRLYEVRTRREIATIRAPAPTVMSVAFDGQGQRLASAAYTELVGQGGNVARGVVKLWRLDSLLRAPISKDVLAETQRATGLKLLPGSLRPVPLD